MAVHDDDNGNNGSGGVERCPHCGTMYEEAAPDQGERIAAAVTARLATQLFRLR